MARKVFISVLGAGIYGRCNYTTNGFCSKETRFIQQATLEYLNAHEWPRDSMAYIFLTDKARTNNWIVENNQRFDYNKNKNVPYTGLQKVLESANFPFIVESVSIPDGKDEAEMWQIFESAYKLLKDGDELYFDLTHSFRYLPMLILVLGNYAKFLKKAKVCSITYGNYEARDEKTNEAPIVDLLPLSSLQDWTFATADFLKNGYADRLVGLSDNVLNTLMRNDETRTDDTIKLKGFVNHLKAFSFDMQTCRGLNIIDASTIRKIKNDIDSLENVVIPQLEPVLKQVLASIEPFNDAGSVSNTFSAAQWCYDNQQYQQATTFMEEGVISYFCQRHGIALDAREKRELITSAFFIKQMNLSEDKWNVKEEWRELLNEIINDELMKNKTLIKNFNSLASLRNDYNHCGMRNNKKDSDKMRKDIKSCLDSIIPLLTQPEEEEEEEEKDDKRPCLINLSNHPFKYWSHEQTESARLYGEIMDIPFPAISPEASETEIQKIADDYVRDILKIEEYSHVTVHIMGEMTFTCKVVSQLKDMGIKCIASTTVRNVEEMANGRKISDFQFVRFRSY